MNTVTRLSVFVACSVLFVYCQKSSNSQATIEKQAFGTLSDGTPVTKYILTNANGMQVQIMDFGATVLSISVPDRNGKFADVTLGYDSARYYERGASYFGGLVGRYGNRIGKGQFTLDGQQYQVTRNDGVNHLHGGRKGFNKVMWTAEPQESPTDPAITMTYVSKDGEEGYPGTVTIHVTFTVTNDNALKLHYTGTTDKTTIFNPTHHSYFNLTGDPNNTILNQELMIRAEKMTPVDAGLITTGEEVDVAGTPFDFRTPTKIGTHINDDNEQLKLGHGYDHNWVLDDYNKSVRLAATVYDSTSGRFMEVLTDQPGLQFYSGNFLNGMGRGKNGVAYKFRTGMCLEAQCFPDSPNKPQWPSPVLKPGETYQQTTIYKFSTH